MKANELMVDDWVLWKDKPVQIARVSGVVYSFGHIDVTLAHCGNGVLETHDIKSISPIPLTPEILEKNGFKRDMFYGEWQFDLDTFPFNFPFSVVQRKNNSWYLGREEVGIAHNREIIDISYVHELQHALRLCGVDKTIEL